MSNLNLENIVGFKAVDKDGNEQNVTVDEMVDMVSTRMVMALSETSTFAAAAATGNDVYENELPTVTDAANVRVLQSSGDAAKMTMQSLASKLGELIGVTGKFVDIIKVLNENVFYKIIGKGTTAIISVGYLWDGVRSLYVVSSNANGSNNRITIITEYTGSDKNYTANFYTDSVGNVYIKGRGDSFTAQLISLTGKVSLEETLKTESELNLMRNNINS